MKNLYLCLCIVLLFSMSVVVKAETAWGYNNNRIAVSSDGNSAPDNAYKWPTGDPDDWGANAAILAIIAKEGLHDKLVHYSYNNFIDAPSGPDAENQNKISCDEGIEHFGGFDPCVFYDVTTRLVDARSSLASEMAKSTAEDPLYFIHAGLAEFVYQAVEEVIAMGKIESLSHVYLVSHSGFNEDEIRRSYHHTWDQIQEICGNRIQYKKIKDQNDCGNANNLWCSGSDFSVWYWMRDHSDSKIQWMYERLEAHTGNKADISDCGMVFYLLTGDDNGTPEKFKTYIGDGITALPQVECTPVPVEGLNILADSVVLDEMMSEIIAYDITPDTASYKGVDWVSSANLIASVDKYGKVTALNEGVTYVSAISQDGGFKDSLKIIVNDVPPCASISYDALDDFDTLTVDGFVASYKDNSRDAIAVDASLYPNKFGASQKTFTGIDGNYDITLHTLTEEDGESTYRLRVGGELIGEFQNPEAPKDLDPYSHSFKNIAVKNGDLIQIESNTHSNGKIPEGEAFAFARGRWAKIDFECATSCMVEEEDGLLVFEAERFALRGDWEVADDNSASGGKYIYFDGANHYSEANLDHEISYTFWINNPGTYTVKWFMRQPVGEQGTDKSNDIWIYLPNGVGYAESLLLSHYEKYYGRSDANFAFNGTAEVHNVGHKWLSAKFPTAGEYTIKICGRSEQLQIDRIVMYKDRTPEQAEIDARAINETGNCGDIVVGGPVTGVSLSEESIIVNEGLSAKLIASVKPQNASNRAVLWSTNDESIATVDASGLVKGVEAGTTHIYATTVDGGFTDSCEVTVKEVVKEAYPTGTPWPIPGKIESEDFDNGGEDAAYHDDDTHLAEVYRIGVGADIEPCGEGGYNIGWIVAGEWLEYTVDVTKAGEYDMLIRYAAQSQGGPIHLEFNGSTVLDDIKFSSTGAWQTYKTLTKKINLAEGVQTMRVVCDVNGMNLNYIEFKSSSPSSDLNINKGDKLHIYPNPSFGNSISVILNGENNKCELSIYNANGKLIFNEHFDQSNIDLDRKIFPAGGLFFLHFKLENEVYTEKLLVN